ncbi:hypothetical protein GTA08_BOTSDO01400 [Neofusicoccum parvum]|uniref:Uncharacterized protein n=1 Tax=Neofusicoccum parvum TaxID=310453 RepID=A0ACB5SI94_9PEZI|nr:hypothetical protein GTA08_BOTSDO01400 [Neofusicoccum parvum]
MPRAQARARAAKTADPGGRRRAQLQEQLKADQRELKAKIELVTILEEALDKEHEAVESWTKCLEDAQDFIREVDLEKAKIKKQICESLEIFPRRLTCPLMRRAVGFQEKIAESRGRVRDMMTDTQTKLGATRGRIDTVRQKLQVTKRRIQYLRRKIKASEKSFSSSARLVE